MGAAEIIEEIAEVEYHVYVGTKCHGIKAEVESIQKLQENSKNYLQSCGFTILSEEVDPSGDLCGKVQFSLDNPVAISLAKRGLDEWLDRMNIRESSSFFLGVEEEEPNYEVRIFFTCRDQSVLRLLGVK